MKINKDELQKALEVVKPGLARREMIEQSTSFVFLKGKIVTYNDEISIVCPINGLEIEGALEASILYSFLAKTNSEEIDVRVEDNELLINDDGAIAGFLLKEEIILPYDAVGAIGDWVDLPEGFVGAVKFCLFSCSLDMSKPVLTCIHVRGRDGYMESSDGFRISRYQIPIFDFSSFLIPVASARVLLHYSPTHISAGNGWIHFKIDNGAVFSCRVFEDPYPVTESFLNVEGPLLDFPHSMGEIVDRAIVFANREYDTDEEVHIKIEKRIMIIKSKGEFGWFEKTIRVRFKEELSFTINPNFLVGVLDKLGQCILGESRLKFVGEGWEHVVMLKKEK